MKALLMLLALGAVAADWPQYRGPNGLGASSETGWRATEPKRLWEVKPGAGFGAVTVAGERVFLVAAGARSNNAETVFCLDATTGKELWSYSYGQTLGRPRSPASCTPAVVDGLVYAYGSGAVLSCLEAATGKLVWTRDLANELNAAPTPYGYCASPLIVAGVVVVPVMLGPGRPQAAGGAYPYTGGVLIGYNAKTGKELWRMTEGCSPWSTPTAGMLDGKLTIVHLTGSAVLGIEPATGKLLWNYNHKEPVRDQRCYSIASSPLIVGDKVIAPTHISSLGTLGLRVRDGKPELLWNGPRQSWYQTPAAWHDLLLLPQGGSSLLACDLATGKQKWATGDLARSGGTTELGEIPETEGIDAVRRPLRQPRAGEASHSGPGGISGGSFIVAHGHVLLVNARGDLIIAKLTADGYEPLANLKALGPDSVHWRNQTYPVLSGGRVFCRNNGSLVCFELRPQR